MLNIILGKPNDRMKDVLISLVLSNKPYEIEDINPNNKVGIPKYLIKLNCLYLDNNFNWIDTQSLEDNLVEALEGIHAFGSEKLHIGFGDNFKISYPVATSIFLISKRFSNDKFTVFVDNLIGKQIFANLNNAISVFKDNEPFRKISKSLYGKGVLTISQESIIERTFNINKDYSDQTLLIVDTHNQHHRNWHGMPDMRNANDEPTSVIKAFTTLIKGLDKFESDYVLFASEGRNGIRFNIDKEYKANRSPITDDLKFQIKACDRLTKKMGFSLVSEEGFEADDIIGSYTREFEKLGGKVIIVTSDKDMYQLISDNVKIFDPFKKKYITEVDCFDKFFVGPEKVIYSLAIQGDTSDNVPGIKGVGDKGAAKLINAYGDIEGIISNIDKLKGKQKEHVENGIDDLRMSYQLVRLYDFLAKEANFSKFKVENYNPFYLIEDDLEYYNINI